jgi:tetraacyldisaccharide 4'-kinase
MLPTGNLRESRSGAKRANCIIITKCPKNLSIEEQYRIKARINYKIPIFFSFIDYDTRVYNKNEEINVSEIIAKDKVIIAGIAKPEPFIDFIKKENDVIMIYPDHHHFVKNEIDSFKESSFGKIIITTEKDYVRLKGQNLNNLYYLPIKSAFLVNNQRFNGLINDYIIKF